MISENNYEAKYGLLAVRVDANLAVPDKEGNLQYVQVTEKRLHPKAKCVAHCFRCRKDWPTLAELKSAHPPMRVMQTQQETHLYALRSDEHGLMIDTDVDP